MGYQGGPEVEALQQLAAGLGEGIGPGALQQPLPIQGVENADVPAGGAQGEGRQGARRPGTVDPGVQQGGHRSGGEQKNRDTNVSRFKPGPEIPEP